MENRLKQVLVNNKNISEELFKSKTKEEAYGVVKDLIPNYSIDDMSKDLEGMVGHAQALSVDDMQAVSGGGILDKVKDVLNKDTIDKIKDVVNRLLK